MTKRRKRDDDIAATLNDMMRVALRRAHRDALKRAIGTIETLRQMIEISAQDYRRLAVKSKAAPEWLPARETLEPQVFRNPAMEQVTVEHPPEVRGVDQSPDGQTKQDNATPR